VIPVLAGLVVDFVLFLYVFLIFLLSICPSIPVSGLAGIGWLSVVFARMFGMGSEVFCTKDVPQDIFNTPNNFLTFFHVLLFSEVFVAFFSCPLINRSSQPFSLCCAAFFHFLWILRSVYVWGLLWTPNFSL